MSTKEEELNNLELLYAGIGGALVGCQIAEKWMVLCLTALFPDEPIESVEMFDQIDEENRRKMIGRLLRELRKHIQLADEFEKLLSDFLKHRNALVHDLGRIHKDPFTAEGMREVEEWALRTNIHAHKIIEIFTTLIHAWMRQLGISEKAGIYDSEYLVELRKTIGPHLHDLVFREESDSSLAKNVFPRSKSLL